MPRTEPTTLDFETDASLTASAPLSSSLVAFRVSGTAMTLIGIGFCRVVPLATVAKGKGCSEQTSLASTPTERRRAQKS